MLPYLVIFTAALFFIIRGLGWLDELADRRNRGRGPTRPGRGSTKASEEARRLEVYKRFLEGKQEPPEDE